MNAIVISEPTGYAGTAICWGNSVYDHYYVVKGDDGQLVAVDDRNVVGCPSAGTRGVLVFVPRAEGSKSLKPVFRPDALLCSCGERVYDGGELCLDCSWNGVTA